MSSIRYRNNYCVIVLTPHGVLGSSAVSGDCIPAALRDGEVHFAPYRGSIDVGLCRNLQRVKLVSVVVWSPDDDGLGTWYDMPWEQYLVGVYTNGGYYIALKNRAPICFPVWSRCTVEEVIMATAKKRANTLNVSYKTRTSIAKYKNRANVMELPELTPFKLEETQFPVVDPKELPSNIKQALDEFMQGKTVSYPTYIYIQDWQEFCAAVARGYITIK